MTIYLVRHASAGSRDENDPSDDERGLDSAGLVQAEKLTDWLRHEGITRILSSPYRRCIETVRPLSDAIGVPIETTDSLAELADVESSWATLASVADEVAVLCSHGDVVPDLIRRAQARGMHVPGKSGSAKGSVWTLEHWDGQGFATGIYTPIPRTD